MDHAAQPPLPAADTRCPVGPELTIAQAAAWRDQLLEWMADGRASLSLDLGPVSDFDSAGVQLLLAARRSLAERGGQLRITSASAPVRDALRVFGLDAALAADPAA